MRILAACGSCLFLALYAAISCAAEEAVFSERVLPFLKKYCVECHAGNHAEAGLSLDLVQHGSHVKDHPDLWEGITDRLRRREMPPAESPQPSADETAKIESWVTARLRELAEAEKPNPGRVTMRRLNRLEYNNTIRDLVGIDFRPAKEFPEDDTGYGFDNIGDVLALPPMLMEKYLAAAEQILDKAICDPVSGRTVVEIAGRNMQRSASAIGDLRTVSQALYTNGTLQAEVVLPRTDYYEIAVRAYGDQAGTEPVQMSIRIDGREESVVHVTAVEDRPQEYSLITKLHEGARIVELSFLNDYYNPEAPNPSQRDRNLTVWSLQIHEAGEPAWKLLPESHRRIVYQPPTPDNKHLLAQQVIERFATRAFRGPLQKEDLQRLFRLFQMADRDGATFEQSLRLALTAVLVSPRFLFRMELDRPTDGIQGTRELRDFELANRLSYFLWSSMPDTELFDLAAAGKLRQINTLEQQVKRMLKDDRSWALVEGFASQWLQLRKLDTTTPDTDSFRPFTPELRADMRRESELFFQSIVQENRSITDLLSSDYTFLNERLARLYGIEEITGKEFRRVNVLDTPRGGLLTQASILTLTSNPTRTSPVKRGKWILENILGTPPPPPPPEVPELAENTSANHGSLRERLEQHRALASCSVCHDRIDPLGFGLENFDGIGQWRTHEGNDAIDASGVLPDGRSFRGPQQLKQILVAQQDDFGKAFAERLLTYALGRGVTRSDRLALEEIAAKSKKENYRFQAVVLAIVQSSPFLNRSLEEMP